jgi:ATP-binding cassette subfamily B multidrug efflux pump
MRLVSGSEVVNHALSMGLIAAPGDPVVDARRRGIGAVVAATAMALRLNGISHWIMWKWLFDNIGTGAGRHHHLVARGECAGHVAAQALQVPRGEIRFE